MSNIDNITDIIDFDETNNNKLLDESNINVGTEVPKLLKKSNSVPLMVLDFKMNCRDAISTIQSFHQARGKTAENL